ncbi:hypothetical protein [Thermoanaerobacter sp. A7A]|uniref:hypothetical protein n=1 Tax=Thermoanaerobacter sp. A7A TaxID=1350366 RepID=UPI000429677D|nr:hypothetical protein [Thermoanaerobacter sp. A7A]
MEKRKRRFWILNNLSDLSNAVIQTLDEYIDKFAVLEPVFFECFVDGEKGRWESVIIKSFPYEFDLVADFENEFYIMDAIDIILQMCYKYDYKQQLTELLTVVYKPKLVAAKCFDKRLVATMKLDYVKELKQ